MNKLNFMTRNGTSTLTVPETIDESFIVDLMSCFFADINKPNQSAIQIVSDKLKSDLYNLSDKYKHVDFNSLKGLSATFNKLDSGDIFLILPTLELEQQQILFLYALIEANGDAEIAKQNMKLRSTQGNHILDYYKFEAFDGSELKPHKIGETIKNNRTCRFCGKQTPHVKFDLKAHAFPEALGNKNVICQEECDDCNSLFSRTIEPSIVTFFEFHRTFFGAHRKSNKPINLSSNQISVSNDRIGNLSIKLPESCFNEADKSFNFQLELGDIKLQDVFRALVKFVAACTSNPILSPDIQDWVRSKTTIRTLPFVKTFINYTDDPKYSRLYIFERKQDDLNIPEIMGQFSFSGHSILFVIPNPNHDPATQDNQMNTFIEKFMPDIKMNMVNLNLSDDTHKKFQPQILFKKNDSP